MNNAKQRFYQMVDFDKNNRSIVSLSRMYNRPLSDWKVEVIPESWLYKKIKNGFDLFDEVDTQNTPFLENAVMDFIKTNGENRYKTLNIWDKNFVDNFNVMDPRDLYHKFIHLYLNKTNNHRNNLIIRIIDKILKKLGI
jgi:hypothetical protein